MVDSIYNIRMLCSCFSFGFKHLGVIVTIDDWDFWTTFERLGIPFVIDCAELDETDSVMVVI